MNLNEIKPNSSITTNEINSRHKLNKIEPSQSYPSFKNPKILNSKHPKKVEKMDRKRRT